MKTDDSKIFWPQQTLRFVILIPHRDLAAPLRAQSRHLFANGLNGAWSFPQAAPLALVKRPLSPAELLSLAKDLRDAASGGKFSLGDPTLVPCPGFHAFFGPALDPPPPPLPYPAVLYPFPALALCAALVAPHDEPLLDRFHGIPPASPGFFRAAMVANLTIKPLAKGPPTETYSFAWRIGKPRWLPAPRERA
jgi:hypothetical protein